MCPRAKWHPAATRGKAAVFAASWLSLAIGRSMDMPTAHCYTSY